MQNCENCNIEKILKEVLITCDGCFAHCKHSYHERYVGMICDNDEICKNHSMYEIDYNKLQQDYNFDKSLIQNLNL